MSARPSALCATTAAVLLAFALPLQAADWHDFENQSLGDWLTTTTGGSGSTAVVEHNGSWMANVSHDGTWSHALSHDYAYNAASVFEFRMHAVSTNPLGTADAMSGVRVTFLNAFNVPLSSAGLLIPPRRHGLARTSLRSITCRTTTQRRWPTGPRLPVWLRA